MTAADVIRALELAPLPHEGGFFRQTWNAEFTLPSSAFPPGVYTSPRSAGTAIYALLTTVDFSAVHRLRTPEVWHFYAGDSLSMLNLFPDGTVRSVRLGSAFWSGEHPQYTVPAGVWQGTRPFPGGKHGWSLIGCTMAPGFAWEDFELGDRAALTASHPTAADEIARLTRLSAS